MFNPMSAGDPVLEMVLWGVAAILALAGFYWIYRITRDIEDN